MDAGPSQPGVHDDDAHIVIDDDTIHDAPVMDNITMDDDPAGDDVGIVHEYILTQPFSRGPTDLSIPKSFKNHVATTIWNGANERGPLKCHNHLSKIRSWSWWEQGNTATFVNIVELLRLSHLARCTYRFVNKIIVSNFVKRLQPKTNTFYLTVGEMTITLDDVATILWLPLVGKSISVRKLTERWAIALVVNTLGIDKQEIKHEMSSVGGNSVRLE
ncbi:protein MAIN-LIKE 1-like [Camellia sinensis]|uniref:protein MAIN-LIKE 1-like n=1 Tax=Camellia sinensis TaxID=4442 RepID=UPI0010367D8D|nr:protein MAIN-LIKE 1-like [Camellia sinensis]